MNCHIKLRGLVQGVGFRPFLACLAKHYQLQGWTRNIGSGVELELCGDVQQMTHFIKDIQAQKPLGSSIEELVYDFAPYQAFADFRILTSAAESISTNIAPDTTLCSPCRTELNDPGNRRYRDIFIACANCGPRFSIVKSLPFDRARTCLEAFPLCADCQQEYENPEDRRYHSQTIGCPNCGPKLELYSADGRLLAKSYDAIEQTIEQLRKGAICAIKGIGGYQLAVDACSKTAIAELRQRKKRPDKPFALMFEDLRSLSRYARPSQLEAELLSSAAAPIVLIDCKDTADLADNISNRLNRLGVMLPSSALHLLILQGFAGPLVITSGNRSGLPMAIDEEAAFSQLSTLADIFLVHDRPIMHRLDDSIYRCMNNQAIPLRIGRGLAPLSFPLTGPPIFSLGAHEKACFAIQTSKSIIVSQHIGDLESLANCDYLEEEFHSYCKMFELEAGEALHDLHPEFPSTLIAKSLTPIHHAVQHHKAHVLSLLAEYPDTGPSLALAWDGMGLGTDTMLWGGEAFALDTTRFQCQRIASLRPFPLAFGDLIARQPRYAALSIAYSLFGEETLSALGFFRAAGSLIGFKQIEQKVLLQRLAEAPLQTCSVARLFDALAAFLGLSQISSYEGQAAMQVEALVDHSLSFQPYPVSLYPEAELLRMDWQTMFRQILLDQQQGVSPNLIATRFHQSLVQFIELLLEHFPMDQVLISGGVFQNKYLVETLAHRLEARSRRLIMGRRIPPNDAGIALGQIMARHHHIKD